MTSVDFIRHALTDPENPIAPSQRAVLTLLSDVEGIRGQTRGVPRIFLFAATGLNSPDPKENDYGLRRILGSISQRLNSSAWYRSREAAAAEGGRQYHLRSDLRDVVREVLVF